MANVILAAAAKEEFDDLPVVIRTRVTKVLERLAKWPNVSGARPLRGALSGHYRVRTGDYRVQFQPVGEDVIVEKIGRRDGFYED